MPTVPFADEDDEPLLVSHDSGRGVYHNDDPCIELATHMPPLTFRPSKIRFVLLLVAILLNISNGMVRTYSVIQNIE